MRLTNSLAERFWKKVNKTHSCWEWLGWKHEGYGRFEIGKKSVLAHKFALKLQGIHIPAKLVCDHICRNRACVRPDHIRIVSIRENVMAKGSRAMGAKNALKTHCKRGHKFEPGSYWLIRTSPYKTTATSRVCKLCRKRK